MLDIQNTTSETINVFRALRLRKIVNGKVCSIRELSRLMGGRIAPSRISEVERGVAEPSQKTLQVYHDFFNVSYDILLGHDELSMAPTNNSFDEILDTLSSYDNSTDKKMLNLFISLGTTDYGLAILYYLSEFIYGHEVTPERLTELFVNFKDKKFQKMDYQSIRQIID